MDLDGGLDDRLVKPFEENERKLRQAAIESEEAVMPTGLSIVYNPPKE